MQLGSNLMILHKTISKHSADSKQSGHNLIYQSVMNTITVFYRNSHIPGESCNAMCGTHKTNSSLAQACDARHS